MSDAGGVAGFEVVVSSAVNEWDEEVWFVAFVCPVGREAVVVGTRAVVGVVNHGADASGAVGLGSEEDVAWAVVAGPDGVGGGDLELDAGHVGAESCDLV